MQRSNVFSHISLSVGNAVTSESLDLESSVSDRRYIFGRSRSGSYVKIIRSRSRLREKKTKNKSTILHVLFGLDFRCLDVECSFFGMQAHVWNI